MSGRRPTAADQARRLVRRGGPRTWAAVAGAGLVAVVVAVVGGLADQGVGTDVPRAPQGAPIAAAAPEVRGDRPSPAPEPASRDDDPGREPPAVTVRPASPAVVDPAAAPVRVRLDGLVDVRVRPVGVDPDGSMELPRAGDVAGWYRYGAAPGDAAGTVVIAAHVDTSDGVGEFAALAAAEPGRTVTVVADDASRHRYEVTDVRRYDKRTVPLDDLFDRTGDPRLVLVTCGGRWDAAAGSYEDNLVVTAVPGAPGRSDR